MMVSDVQVTVICTQIINEAQIKAFCVRVRVRVCVKSRLLPPKYRQHFLLKQIFIDHVSFFFLNRICNNLQ